MSNNGNGPDFRPHFLMRSPHTQTVAAIYLPGAKYKYQATRHLVDVEEDDRIVLHDDRPNSWQPGEPIVLLLHGLGGCFLSRYMIRIAAKLNVAGFRTFRMDQRGCGAGLRLSRTPFHSGRSEDAAAAVRFIAAFCPESPVTLVGFSMGGNIALKLLGEVGDQPCGHLAGAIAICPPMDLTCTIDTVERPRNRVYRRFILNTLLRQHQLRCQLVSDVKTVAFARRPRGLRELDEIFTAPVCGFADAASYYRESSSLPLASGIRLPARILAAEDDPVVPIEQFASAVFPPAVRFQATQRGGHLGFVGRAGRDPDRRWMEWRVIEWLRSMHG